MATDVRPTIEEVGRLLSSRCSAASAARIASLRVSRSSRFRFAEAGTPCVALWSSTFFAW
ncbi:hypothetical protein PSMK_31430 [Phycisphaera mikurensis NBRC 102666]|uniref:Uncharacterized protein n=1 Tax=Phycisphaera mikurensis (strain NBRC 102666 / KCTC 22515 / FYK2301M01) TaxID=1142394 RepID=I0IJ64_PHYMF|nr:hypothetical protein PSMK_31430 [Phycisphaera mikurensis NBRC 102666]